MTQGNDSKSSTNVITIRISDELNTHLDKVKYRLGLSKAELIRNYLEISRFVLKQKSSLKSLNDRDLIIIKKSYLRKLLENREEEDQIILGDKLGRFINDMARINGKLDDIDYKLDLCDSLGFFPKFSDDKNYILFSKKFGPQKFVESFTWRIFNKSEFNKDFISSKIGSTSKTRQAYEKTINPVIRSSSHYSFEYAKTNPEKGK